MKPNRRIEGIWFPIEIWEDTNLDMVEKAILIEIHYLDNDVAHCYASNEYLAEFCKCSEKKVTRTISKLIDLGYIELVSFDGRIRTLKSNLKFYGGKSLRGQNVQAD